METLLAFVIGLLFSMGLYLMMRRSMVKLLLGLALLSNAANLLIFTSAGLQRGQPPLISADQQTLAATYPDPSLQAADPLPQALVLTAIVIGFAVLAFTAVLLKRAYQVVGEDDLDHLRSTDI